MTTTREKLTNLMTLIDMNSDNIKEGDYLTICNLMRDLHSEATQPQPQPVPHQPQPQPVPHRPLVRNLAAEFDQEEIDRRRSILGGLNHALALERRVLNITTSIHYKFVQINRLRTTTPRVCLRHKLTVLRTLDLDLVNNTPSTGLTQTQLVHAIEQAYFTKYPNTPVNFLQIKYREFRARVNISEIDELRIKIGQLRSVLDAHRRARQIERESDMDVGTIDLPSVQVTSLDHHLVPP